MIGSALALGALETSDDVVDFQLEIPGRLERIALTQEPVAFVDYAHSPDALERALIALRAVSDKQTLWVLFGCGGDRDRSKRPLMGAVAESHADRLIVTSDNPLTEDPIMIIQDIMGFNAASNNYYLS